MNTNEGNLSFLLRNFQQFYTEVINIKQLILTQQSRPTQEKGGEDVQDRDFVTAKSASQTLRSLLEMQETEVGQRGIGLEVEVYSNAQYVMAALADEIFMLELDWPDKDNWSTCLLERALFYSRVAGEKIFSGLDTLLEMQTPDRIYVDLATVYLFALRLGFRGKYRQIGPNGEPGEEDEKLFNEYQRKLTEYRKKLTQWIRESNARFGNEDIPMFLNAYTHTLDRENIKRLASQRDWVKLLLFVLFAYVSASYYIWNSSLKPLNLILNLGVGGMG